MELLIVLVIASAIVGIWANVWGRSGWTWGIVALFVSPLLTGIALLISGKSIEKKAEELKLMNELINK